MYNSSILQIIDTQEKAYALGCLANFVYINKIKIIIFTSVINRTCLFIIKSLINPNLKIEECNNSIRMTIKNEQIYNDICKHLKIKNSIEDIEFPELKNELIWSFIHGYFEIKSYVSKYIISTAPKCVIYFRCNQLFESIYKFINISGETIKYNNTIILQYINTNCLDFLGMLYEKSSIVNRNLKYFNFIGWLNMSEDIKLPYCYVYRVNKDAVIPNKTHTSDVGYDLTIISKVKEINPNVYMFDTGIKISLEHGYYAEIVPRSSIIKSGFMLANNIGIIDPSYTGNIYIALVKLKKNIPDLILPFRCCQLIIRKQYHITIKEINYDLEETIRNEGGFGSTSK